MSLNDAYKNILKMACMQHPDVPVAKIRVMVGLKREGPSDVAEDGANPFSAPKVVDEAETWEAQVYMGGGKWGRSTGYGETPESAVACLLSAYVHAHEGMDETRSAALVMAKSSIRDLGIPE